MDSAKQEVSLSVVDENKQRDNDTYLGLLLFETADNDKYKTKGELPITMPKVGHSVNHLSRLMGKPTMWFLNRSDTNRFKHRRWLEAEKFGFRKKRNCTIRVAKTKALISFAVTAKLICVFVFAYADRGFSHEAAHLSCLYSKVLVYAAQHK